MLSRLRAQNTRWRPYSEFLLSENVWLAQRFGVHAADMVARGEFGKMAALRGTQIVSVALQEATAQLKTVDPALYGVAEVFFG